MSTRALNAQPTLGKVAIAQLRMVALLQRREFVLLGVLAVASYALGLWGYAVMTPPDPSANTGTISIAYGVAPFTILLGALWPMSVWRLDDPARRGYFWSLPVAQPAHTLLRVAVGWAILMSVSLVLLLYAAALLIPGMLRFDQGGLSLEAAWLPFVAATLPYLLVSAFAVAFEHPVRVIIWIWVAIGILALAWEGGDRASMLLTTLLGGVRSFWIALTAHTFVPVDMMDYDGRWHVHYLGWLGGALILTVAAAFWKRDVS
jgi:hypothetical protein